MNKLDRTFNHWQLYHFAQKMYTDGAHAATIKLHLKNQRNNVYHFKRYVIGNDVMYIAENSKEINFIFLGSNDVIDWLNNFDAIGININDIKFHQGFYLSLLDLYKYNTKNKKSIKLIDLIKEKLNTAKDNNFIGHSRGGALALMAATLLKLNNYADHLTLYVTTYGQPRIADRNLAEYLVNNSIDYLRVFFTHDIVCDVPPIEMGYEHPYNSKLMQLPGAWWHRFRFMFKKVHLDYDRVINNLYDYHIH